MTRNSVSKDSYTEKFVKSCVKRAKKILLNKPKRLRVNTKPIKSAVDLNFDRDEWLCERTGILSSTKSPVKTPVKKKAQLKQMTNQVEFSALIRKPALHYLEFNFKMCLIYFYFVWF